MSDLLPCPAHESHKPVTFWKRDVGGTAYRIECGYCGCKVVMPTREAAIAAWNTRTPQEPQWRPIETAPRDGTEVLLSDRHYVACGRWIEDEFGWGDRDRSGDSAMYNPPTHWQPLPAPPEATP